MNNSNSAQAEFFLFYMNKKFKILILTIIILTLFFCFSFLIIKEISIKNSTTKILSKEIPPPLSSPLPRGRLVVGPILEINGTKYQSQIEGEISIADFMEKLKNEGKISFVEKNYIGMGKFIESINEIKNGEQNWIYYVNGQKANIGISNYKINQGDIVSWKYEKIY